MDRNGQICVASYRETRLFFNLVVLKGCTNTPEKLAAVLGKQHVTLLLAKFVFIFAFKSLLNMFVSFFRL